MAYLDDHASYDKTGRITSPTLEPITRLVAGDGRAAAGLPGDPHHRDQRQGFDGADGDPPADGPGPHRRDVHQPAPRAGQRAPGPQRRGDQRRGARRADRRRGRPGGPDRCSTELLRGVHGRGVPLVRRHRRRRRGRRGRPARSLGRHQRRRRPGRRGDQHRDGPQRVRRSDARRHRPGEGRDHRARLGRRDRRDRPGAGRRAQRAAGRRPPGPRRRLRDGRQHAGRRRPARRHPHADDDLPRRVRAPARGPPGRQRVDRPDRHGGLLRRVRWPRTSSRKGSTQ